MEYDQGRKNYKYDENVAASHSRKDYDNLFIAGFPLEDLERLI